MPVCECTKVLAMIMAEFVHDCALCIVVLYWSCNGLASGQQERKVAKV